jgi:hypothetical protein
LDHSTPEGEGTVLLQNIRKHSSNRTLHCRRPESAVHITSSHLKSMSILFFHIHLGTSNRFFPSKLIKIYYASQYNHIQVNIFSANTSIPLFI